VRSIRKLSKLIKELLKIIINKIKDPKNINNLNKNRLNFIVLTLIKKVKRKIMSKIKYCERTIQNRIKNQMKKLSVLFFFKLIRIIPKKGKE
jgi:DNA-binding NarL/FixJ family response regulator